MISQEILHVLHAFGWKNNTCPHSRRHTHTHDLYILQIIASFPISSILISRWLAFKCYYHEGCPSLHLQSSWAPQLQCCDQKLFISYIIKFNVSIVALKAFCIITYSLSLQTHLHSFRFLFVSHVLCPLFSSFLSCLD